MKGKLSRLFVLFLEAILILTACGSGGPTSESVEEVTGSVQSEVMESTEISKDLTKESGDESTSGKWKAGTYEGEATGHLAPIKVRVSLDEKAITKIEMVENADTARLFDLAWDYLPQEIIDKQSVEVDGLAGATGSSYGIKAAVKDALGKADATEYFSNPVGKEDPVQKEDVEVDIVIVGAGASGLSAAIEARKNTEVDAKVLVLEKMSYTGGSFGLSGGLFWTGNGSKYTPEDSFTPESLVEWFEMRSEIEINKPLVRHIADVAGEKFDYLIEAGAPWDYKNPIETYPESRIYRFETDIAMSGEGQGKFRSASAGNLAAEWMKEKALEMGAEIRTNAKVTEILLDNDGQATGVKVEGEETYNVYADKVIIATGGFANSVPHLERFAEDSAAKWPFVHAGAQGEGHDMLEAVGAHFTGNGVMAYEALTANMGYKGNLGSLVWVPELVVNLEGKRFVDETGQSTDIALQTYLQTDDTAYGIIDSRTDRNEDLEEGVSKGLILKAESLEELAEQMGITDVETFKQTVKKYNDAALNGAEDEMGANPELMKAVEDGPYYAIRLYACMIGTMPGVVVDENCQVLNKDGAPIGNLYAAGEVMFGNIFNRVYPATGTAIAQAIYSGAIASEHAVINLEK